MHVETQLSYSDQFDVTGLVTFILTRKTVQKGRKCKTEGTFETLLQHLDITTHILLAKFSTSDRKSSDKRKMSSLYIYSLFYFLISACIFYPPIEFVAAGLTLKDVFRDLFGCENEFFIQYHIRRSVFTLFIHSMLPLGNKQIL